MKIAAIEIVRLDLQRQKPTSTRRRQSWSVGAERSYPINIYPEFPRVWGGIPGETANEVWVRVTAEDGTWGLGQTHWGNLIAPIVRDHLTPLLVGRDCMAIELLNDLMWRASLRIGATGLAGIARGAVDLALWDLKGKLLGVPVYTLLGGPARETIECYCSGDDLDWGMELGFTAFKINNPVHFREGPRGLDRLEQAIAQARETIGASTDLMLNCVMSFDVDYAIRAAERLLPYRLRWIEEPLPPHDMSGHERLKQAVPTMPIATGEDHQGRHAFLELVERRCVDVLQPELRWTGGLSEALKIHAIGEAAGIPTLPHMAINTPFGQHFAFAMPDSTPAEFALLSDPGVPLAEANTIPGTAVPKDGKVTPSDAPGFGIDIKPSQIVA